MKLYQNLSLLFIILLQYAFATYDDFVKAITGSSQDLIRYAEAASDDEFYNAVLQYARSIRDHEHDQLLRKMTVLFDPADFKTRESMVRYASNQDYAEFVEKLLKKWNYYTASERTFAAIAAMDYRLLKSTTINYEYIIHGGIDVEPRYTELYHAQIAKNLNPERILEWAIAGNYNSVIRVLALETRSPYRLEWEYVKMRALGGVFLEYAAHNHNKIDNLWADLEASNRDNAMELLLRVAANDIERFRAFWKKSDLLKSFIRDLKDYTEIVTFYYRLPAVKSGWKPDQLVPATKPWLFDDNVVDANFFMENAFDFSVLDFLDDELEGVHVRRLIKAYTYLFRHKNDYPKYFEKVHEKIDFPGRITKLLAKKSFDSSFLNRKFIAGLNGVGNVDYERLLFVRLLEVLPADKEIMYDFLLKHERFRLLAYSKYDSLNCNFKFKMELDEIAGTFTDYLEPTTESAEGDNQQPDANSHSRNRKHGSNVVVDECSYMVEVLYNVGNIRHTEGAYIFKLREQIQEDKFMMDLKRDRSAIPVHLLVRNFMDSVSTNVKEESIGELKAMYYANALLSLRRVLPFRLKRKQEELLEIYRLKIRKFAFISEKKDESVGVPVNKDSGVEAEVTLPEGAEKDDEDDQSTTKFQNLKELIRQSDSWTIQKTFNDIPFAEKIDFMKELWNVKEYGIFAKAINADRRNLSDIAEEKYLLSCKFGISGAWKHIRSTDVIRASVENDCMILAARNDRINILENLFGSYESRRAVKDTFSYPNMKKAMLIAYSRGNTQIVHLIRKKGYRRLKFALLWHKFRNKFS